MSSESGSILPSDRMLSELLALNEEMIVQLRVERMDSGGTTDFITGMIEQHEKAAASLRAQLKSYKTNAPAIQHASILQKPLTC